MIRRALRAGDHLWIECPSPEGTRRVDTQLVARDDAHVLVLCHAPDLEGVDLQQGAEVIGSWHDGEEHLETTFGVTHFATYPVGSIGLVDLSAPTPDARRSPRLHRVMPAQIWTPETGHLAATVVDISVGGARLRMRERPPAIECEVILGLGDSPVEVRATVLEIIPAGVSGRQHEVRLAFGDLGPDELSQLAKAVSQGIVEAIAELGFDARAV